MRIETAFATRISMFIAQFSRRDNPTFMILLCKSHLGPKRASVTVRVEKTSE